MKKKDILFIIAFITIVSISFLYLFQTSYAKYRKRTQTGLEGTIAQWNIKVNDEAIFNKTTLSNSITPTIENNPHTKEGTLAPGSSGYFDIVIDAEEVDVDFTYTVTTEFEEENALKDLIIKSYQINEGEISTSIKEIIGDIEKNTKKTTIRVFFEWNDEETNLMDNKEDTEYSTSGNYKIKVMINFEQKK